MTPRTSNVASYKSEHRYITIGISNEFLCIPIGQVREIQEVDNITPVPGTPGWLKGVLNLRGDILSVVDISSFLGLSPVKMGRTTRMVVVEGSKFQAAFVADTVLEVLTIPPKEIKSSEEISGAVNKAYARGVYVSRDLLYSILDVEQLLSCDPMMQFQ
jgi:purine-binding chemotaxis protein CheW